MKLADAVLRLPSRARKALKEGSRKGFLILGFLFLCLGIIGAFLPVMPTTVFIIAAAWAFSRSSPRLESWLLGHPRFGSSLVAWRAEGAIPRRGKIAACVGKTVGFGVFLIVARPNIWLALLVFTVMTSVAAWIVRRPEPGGGNPVVPPGPTALPAFAQTKMCAVSAERAPCD